MAAAKGKKKDALLMLVEKKIMEHLESPECSRMDLRNAMEFLKIRDQVGGGGYGDGFKNLPPEDPEDPAQPDYSPSPITSLAEEEEPYGDE